MTANSSQPEKDRSQSAVNLTLVAVAGQVGCLTLIVVLAALFGGLWLDSQLDTRPMFTVGLMILSVPVTLVAMFWVVRKATARLREDTDQESEEIQEEAQGG